MDGMKLKAKWVKTESFTSARTGNYEFWGVFVYGDRRVTVYLGVLR